MSGADGPTRLKHWMARNQSSLISNPGNQGNQVTAYLLNIINNNNINIISASALGQEAVTLDSLEKGTRVTESGGFRGVELPELPRQINKANQINPNISPGYPGCPSYPSQRKRERDALRQPFLWTFLPGLKPRPAAGPRRRERSCATYRPGSRVRAIEIQPT